MKNLFLLPTEKPSRLFKFANQLHLDTIPKDYYKKYNIYITSDEEIKDDWCYDEYNKVVFKNTCAGTPGASKKIILTTDQDLIADGIQSIDDEFLEWFVKNPSCEVVEVQDWVNFYKIFIPQEEVFEMYSHLYGKTVTMNDRFETKHIWSEELALKNKGRWVPEEEKIDLAKLRTTQFSLEMATNAIQEPKQETLEEAAEKIAMHCNDDFIKGAKWMLEKLQDFDTWKEWKNTGIIKSE